MNTEVFRPGRRPLVGAVLWLLLAGCSDSAPERAEAPPPALDETPPVESVADEGNAVAAATDDLGEGVAGSDDEQEYTARETIIEFTQNAQRAPGGLSYGSTELAVDSLSPAQVDAVARARAVLADYLEQPQVDDASLVSVEPQRWNNSSLGCGKPGEMALQALQDGYKVVFVLEGLRHQVHLGQSGGRVCERLQGLLQAPKRAVNLGALPGLQQQAMTQLAAELAVDPSEIEPLDVEAVTWSSTALDCPTPGTQYTEIAVSGYRLPFTVGNRTYLYHTDGRRLVNCGEQTGVAGGGTGRTEPSIAEQ